MSLFKPISQATFSTVSARRQGGLRSAGGDVSVTDKNFASNVVVDRDLITGQNPASDRAMADALIEALDRAAA